jgi:phosphatidylglycerophosphate synthase
VRPVRTSTIIAVSGQVALLAVLAGTVGLGPLGWAVGVASGLFTNAALARALRRAGARGLGPADVVTLVRATLVGGVAALVADGLVAATSVPVLVTLAAVALVLDAVDGQVARRTRTVSPVGARFDMEVDAFLILVLSLHVAPSAGGWVLAIGFARYALLVAGRPVPWLRRPVPPRYWRKVVAAVQGVVLTAAAAKVLPAAVLEAVLAIALVLLAESFGRDVVWQWRYARGDRSPVDPPRYRSGVRAEADRVLPVLAFVAVWVALVLPDRFDQVSPAVFVRIPVEGLVLVAGALVLPPRVRTAGAAVVGLLLALLSVAKILDMGFYAALDRPFDPVTDWTYLGSATGVLRDSIGSGWATTAAVVAAVFVLAVFVGVILSVVRLTKAAARHRGSSVRALAGLAAAWLISAAFGIQVATHAPVASTSAAGFAVDQVDQVTTSLQDQQRFQRSLGASDAYRSTPGADLLTALRGKDVVFAFVESYGRVAVQDTAFSRPVDQVLRQGTRDLDAAGFGSRSAFLTSPTFGGISWLAHSTLQSGLWIDSQHRYNELVRSDRFTLSDAFKRAGWRTVSDIPSDSGDWPAGHDFYHYDRLYNGRNVGYAGPNFSYSAVPDQYTLAEFQRRELATPHHRPVMAEIDLTSSHTPWAPLPKMVYWNEVGDGSVFGGMPAQGKSPGEVWQHAKGVQAAYGQSIQYSLTALTSFVTTFPDPNLVLVALGDHQPASVVSGSDPGHDVPISIIAHDPKVLAGISSWGWQKGLLPGPHAPVSRMDTFRDRFLTAFGPQPGPTGRPQGLTTLRH